jgi:PEGA domain
VDAKGRPLSQVELLPDGRWVKRMDIRSEPAGARIIVGGYYVGETPMEVPIPCTPSGRFPRTTQIRLLPTETGGRVHGDIFPAGSIVPSRWYFSGTESAKN